MDLRAKVVLFALPAMTAWGWFDARAHAWLPWPAFLVGAITGLTMSLKGSAWGFLNPAAGMLAMSRLARQHGDEHGNHASRADWQHRMRLVLWFMAFGSAGLWFFLLMINPDFFVGQTIMAIAFWLGAWWICGWILDDAAPAFPPGLSRYGQYVKPASPEPPAEPTPRHD